MTARSLLGRVLLVALGLALAASAGLGLAEGPRAPAAAPLLVPPTLVPVDDLIPVQGRLTDSAGQPLDGPYQVTFNLYDSEGFVECTDTKTVTPTNGLFSAYIARCASMMEGGRQLWLGVQVGEDAEMTPRQPIYPVPYAFSLRAGAKIAGAVPPSGGALSGAALRATNTDYSGDSSGLCGISTSPSGQGVLGWNESGGHGVRAHSWSSGSGGAALQADNGSPNGIGAWVAVTSTDSSLVVENHGAGPLIKAFGGDGGEDEFRVKNNGAIESKADSYVFIPGSEGQRQGGIAWTTENRGLDGSLTVGVGGLGNTRIIYTGALPGVLYGQRVKVRNVAVFYKVELNGGNAFISGTQAYRTYHNGTNTQIVDDATDRTSTTYGYYVVSTTGDNLLDVDDGFVSVVLFLYFDDNLARIQIGGIRLGLGHHELY